ncbi:hypothetical protein JCM9152_4256 [Halalkalibacter hemicellulosilyticusJCM 9152]|uniref:Uncharacterized protein n=1 Tax=Halalkalibacter hemicellulosilyticusJCM 9152 TaxID=1236971 RepID=W4QKS2_9BACI|nr:hypothetical protein JCM9152_4256 [Halalkalibacter hemicellulosilyticusJCM 9152]
MLFLLILFSRSFIVQTTPGHADIETRLKDYAHVIKELREHDEQVMTNTFKKMFTS